MCEAFLQRQKMEKRPVTNKGISPEEDFGFCLKHSRKDSVIREVTWFSIPVIPLMRSGKSRKRQKHQMGEEGTGGKTTEGKAPMGGARESRGIPQSWKELVSLSLYAGQVHPHPFRHHWEAGLCRY